MSHVLDVLYENRGRIRDEWISAEKGWNDSTAFEFASSYWALLEAEADAMIAAAQALDAVLARAVAVAER